ncbi:hypothetical protein GTQ99_12910 [Kineococcus sp. T13]|nr:hypothetical protein [Kineococcus vitellinus]
MVAVDGRSAAGKSTLATRLVEHAARGGRAAALVHTDDLAWHESFFGWGALAVEGVLAPLHRGVGVRHRPPAWERRGRPGAVEVPAGSDLVVLEGVGAAQRQLAPFLDATVWVQSDAALAERRGIARDVAEGVNGDVERATAFWHEWVAEELVFLQRERPWERADLVVAGTPTIPLAAGRLAVAPGPLHP